MQYRLVSSEHHHFVEITPDPSLSVENIEQISQSVLGQLDGRIVTIEQGVDRCQVRFEWQDDEFILFIELLTESYWIEAVATRHKKHIFELFQALKSK